jgi:glycosyltransferase involved in cell wall biosynthesis
MIGQGWFPDQLGGLNRYYRELLLELPEARGLVLGPADDAPQRVVSVSDHQAPLAIRALSLIRAARMGANGTAVVDAHFALYALFPLLLGGLRQKPLLVHFQGPWADENVAAGDRSIWRRYARRRLERAVYRRAATIVTLTGAFKRVLVERYGIAPWHVTVRAPGVDFKVFCPGDRKVARRELQLEDEDFVGCCARRLVPRMGIDVLLDAWQAAFGRSHNARLLIAGDGEQYEHLQQEIGERGLAHSVSLLGRVSDEVLLQMYRAADVNVVPTIAVEGFGLIVLEAAACGTPSVVTDAGGLPEAVAGLGDLVVPASDVGALAARLRRAQVGDIPSREKTRGWVERHSWSRVADDHRRLYARLAESEPDSRLRVVYLDHVAQLSGGELALLRLLPALTDINAHVIVAEEGPFFDRLVQGGISVELLRMPERTRHLRKDRVGAGRLPMQALLDTAAYIVRLAWRLHRLHPDLVHTNSMKSGVYGGLAGRLAGVPVVWHVRDRVERDYLPGPAVVLIRGLTWAVPRLVISNSRATRTTLWRRRRSIVIGEALGMPITAHGRDPVDGPLVSLMLGRLAPWKGQDVFLRAFADAFPDGPQRARIVGTAMFGEDEHTYAAGLRELACSLRIEDRVDFCGHREDVASELHTADLLVHASVAPEPFGQVVIEGMAAGLPVLATRGGGPAELITDGVNGFLYSPGDVEALSSLLRRLNDDPDLRARLGRAGRKRAADFAPRSVSEQMMSAYQIALRPSRRRDKPGRMSLGGERARS